MLVPAVYFCIAFGKSEITNVIRGVLDVIRSIREAEEEQCLDEFTKAGLMDALRKCTKIVITDEADMTFADVGLFHCSPKPANENNCRGSSVVFVCHFVQ